MKAGTPDDMLEQVALGSDLVVPLANGEPVGLIEALDANADRLDRVRVHQMHALHDHPYIHGAYGDRLRHVSYFLSEITRPAYWSGGCDLVPNHFSEVPLILRQSAQVSMVLAAASAPDSHGYFSLGTNADYVASMIGRVPFWLEVNAQMPRTFGENVIHISQVAGWTETDRPLVAVPPVQPDERDEKMAALIAERVPDGATIQVGIGAVPNALLAALRGHRELGVHTELVSDGVMDLVERGVITGSRKRHRRNKHVATFALGTQALYEWLHDNGSVDMLPVDWVNNPRIIAREPNFVSINATTEVDLFGQCASETIEGRYWSSSGGQADFARGAMYSEGGKAFIVLRSTTRDGRTRIRARLSDGSVVTTLKNTVDHVVTEWGVAELSGKPLAERARQLIGIAHPDHRETLEREARESGLLR